MLNAEFGMLNAEYGRFASLTRFASSNRGFARNEAIQK